MKQFLILFLSFCLSCNLFARENNELLFNKGVEAFNNKDYRLSAQIFGELEKADPLNATLHYNLGTSYLKLQTTGLSIYHLEKSLKLRPGYEPARINLNFAEKLKTKMSKGNLPVPQQQMLYSVFDFITPNSWAYMAIATMIAAAILFCVFRISSTAAVKKLSLALGMLLFVVSISSYFISKNQSGYLMANHYVIVKEAGVSLMSEPRAVSKIEQTLYEGSKGFIKEETDQWIKIQLQSDTIGWVEKSKVLQY